MSRDNKEVSKTTWDATGSLRYKVRARRLACYREKSRGARPD